MRQNNIRVPKWAYIAVPLVLSLFAADLIAQVQRRADDFRSTQVDLVRVQGYFYQLHGIEEEAVAEKHLSEEMATEKDQIDQHADNDLLNLRRTHPTSVFLERVQTRYLAYDAALDAELPFLRKGDIEGAERVAGKQVDPTYNALIQDAQKAIVFYNQKAGEEILQATWGISILLVSGALCLGLFMRRVAETQRAQAVWEAQRSEEERTQAVLETALDAVVGMDAQGLIIGWNAQAETIFGWTKAEAIGRPLIEVIVPDALREDSLRGFAGYIAGGEWPLVGRRVELDALHKQGHLFPIAMSLSCVRTGNRLTFSAFICDISERKQAQAQLQESEERYRSVVEHVKDVIFTTDIAANWTFLNRAWTEITGYSIEESIGRNFLYFACEEDHIQSIRTLEVMEQRQKNYASYEMRLKCKAGENRWIEVRLQSTLDQSGDLIGFFGTLSDITGRKSAAERLEHQALHDALTGLPNRLLFQDRLGGALSRMARLQSGVAVLFIDLDNFKFVNDSMGHEAGDDLLKSIALILQTSARRGDTVARLGGDEFTLLLENVDSVEDAVQTAERIIFQLQQPIAIVGREVFASASIGIAFSSDDGLEAEDLLRDADTAMYQAKSHGKCGFVVFNASMNADAVDRMEIETGLRFALARNELQVYYQPLVDLKTGCMNGVEALLRWEHPTQGLLTPGKFIPVAEETGLIVPIGYWVLEEACRQMQEWKAAYPAYGEFTVNVNLSGKQLQRSDVVERVAAALEKTRIAPGALKLEITETVMMADVEDTVAKLHALKALGVKLAMDDFGTGYSSMASLNIFPLDTVKIDRAFIKRLTEHHESGSVVAAMIMLSKALHLDVTGEGIETAEQLLQLQGLGCHIGQGYFFAKPLPPAMLTEGIAEGSHHFSKTIQPSSKETIEQYLRAA